MSIPPHKHKDTAELQSPSIENFLATVLGPTKDTFLRLCRIRHEWHNRKCTRAFVIHNFKSTESWENKANNI